MLDTQNEFVLENNPNKIEINSPTLPELGGASASSLSEYEKLIIDSDNSQIGTFNDEGNLILRITTNDNGYIENYAVLGDIEGSIPVSITPLEYNESFKLNPTVYKYVNGVLELDQKRVDEYDIEKLRLAQAAKQELNNAKLAEFLRDHPLEWSDGKRYGVTQEDQQEIALNLTQYQLTTRAGLAAVLEWHAVREECREFTLEELSQLALAIANYVYPMVRRCQMLKAQIYAAETCEELEAISLEYVEENNPQVTV